MDQSFNSNPGSSLGSPMAMSSPLSSTTMSPGSRSRRPTVNSEEIMTLRSSIALRDDAIDIPDAMKGHTYNMRTWAAAQRNVARRSSKQAQKMRKWDSSYDDDDDGGGSFLTNGESALLASRKPVRVRCSRNTLDTIRSLRPGSERSKQIIDQLENKCERDVRSRVAVHDPVRRRNPGLDMIPLSPSADLTAEILTPQVAERRTAALELAHRTPSPAEFRPRSTATHRIVKTDALTLLSPSAITGPADSLPSLRDAEPRTKSPTRTELPSAYRVDYAELHREQDIVHETKAEQEANYKERLEDLDQHIADVTESIQAMLDGVFGDPTEKRLERTNETAAQRAIKQSQRRKRIPEFYVDYSQEKPE